jgi:hypothetical protein
MATSIFGERHEREDSRSADDDSEVRGVAASGVRRTGLNCPLCGSSIAHPGYCRDGSAALAECLRCDLLFELSV